MPDVRCRPPPAPLRNRRRLTLFGDQFFIAQDLFLLRINSKQKQRRTPSLDYTRIFLKTSMFCRKAPAKWIRQKALELESCARAARPKGLKLGYTEFRPPLPAPKRIPNFKPDQWTYGHTPTNGTFRSWLANGHLPLEAPLWNYSRSAQGNPDNSRTDSDP